MKRTSHTARFFSYAGLGLLVLIAAFGAVWITNQTFIGHGEPARPSGRVGSQLLGAIAELSIGSNSSNCRMLAVIKISVICDGATIELAAFEAKVSQQGWQYKEDGPSSSWNHTSYYHREHDLLCIEVDGHGAIKSISITRHF